MTFFDSVLITGGSGFLGRALTRWLLADTKVQRICIYSRGEAAQAAMREAIPDPAQRIHWFIGDVRDAQRLELAMWRVALVIHAAALKRIDVCAYNPLEAVATNVVGTSNVISAALRAGVGRVVGISSDKAVEPTTHYGTTKACAERLLLEANAYHRTRFAVCRYGNVAGSTGSVIPRWRAAKANGAPAFITDPEATRFWMTIEEAVDLVARTAWEMPREIAVAKDLPAYRLNDLADAMGMPAMECIGLQVDEKLHERLVPGGPTSYEARRMGIAELQAALTSV